LKLRPLQNKVIHTIGNFPWRTRNTELHVTFNIPCVCDFITQLCRQRKEVIHNQANATVRYLKQGESMHRKYKRLKPGGGQAYDSLSD
jgi:hypothetical protein